MPYYVICLISQDPDTMGTSMYIYRYGPVVSRSIGRDDQSHITAAFEDACRGAVVEFRAGCEIMTYPLDGYLTMDVPKLNI